MSECPHSPFIEAEWCSTCLAASRPAAAPLPGPAATAAFEARYSGHCRSCNLGWGVGSRIRRVDGDAYVHAGCPDG